MSTAVRPERSGCDRSRAARCGSLYVARAACQTNSKGSSTRAAHSQASPRPPPLSSVIGAAPAAESSQPRVYRCLYRSSALRCFATPVAHVRRYTHLTLLDSLRLHYANALLPKHGCRPVLFTNSLTISRTDSQSVLQSVCSSSQPFVTIRFRSAH